MQKIMLTTLTVNRILSSSSSSKSNNNGKIAGLVPYTDIIAVPFLSYS